MALNKGLAKVRDHVTQKEARDKISSGDTEGALKHIATGGATGSELSKIGKSVMGGKKGGGDGVPDPKAPNPTQANVEAITKALLAGQQGPMQATTFNPGEGPKAGQIGFTPTQQSLDPSQQAQFREQQMALAQALQQQAAGQGPSLAGGQLRQGIEASLAAQQAALASQRGGFNPALARQAMQTGAEMRGQEAMQAAQLRMQEQLNAQNALAQLSGQAREQDIGIAAQNAQLGQDTQAIQAQLAGQQAGLDTQANLAGFQGNVQAGLANAAAQNQVDLSVMQNNTQLLQQAAQLQAAAAAGDQAAALQFQQLVQSGALAKAQADQAAQNAQNQMLGTVLQTGGAIVGGIYGGPAGAAAGGAAGGAAAKAINSPAGEAQASGPPIAGGAMGSIADFQAASKK